MPKLKLTFLAKLIALVAVSASTSIVVLWISTALSERAQGQLSLISERYIPQLELGPQLEQTFALLPRGFQDATAASDRKGLAATEEIRARFLERLAQARGRLEPEVSAKLRGLVESYYVAAHEVSKQIIEGRAGEDSVEAIADMQARQALVEDYLKHNLIFDKAKLVSAFGAALNAQRSADSLRLLVSLSGILIVCLLSFWISRGTIRAMAALTSGFERFGRGELDKSIQITSEDELAQVAALANKMVDNLRSLAAERARADWLKEGLFGLSDALRGELTPEQVAERTLRFVAPRVGALVSGIYLRHGDDQLRLSYEEAMHRTETRSGLRPDPRASTETSAEQSIHVGNGLLGRAALGDDVTVVPDVPSGYLQVRSGLGRADPVSLALVPFRRFGKPLGILELAFFKPNAAQDLEFLTSTRETVSMALETALSRRELHHLLEASREQAGRLVAQEEELRQSNQELIAQQEELRAANEDLESHRSILSKQNDQLEDARRGLEDKAQELTKASEYKSQFLANMSHELRTPLNSMLLLSHLLAENEARNLTPKQVEYCQTVHSAGKDLLALINQILDLAKIEAGREDVYLDAFSLEALSEHLRAVFSPLAAEKRLALTVVLDPDVPKTMVTDQSRLERILTNLLGNAIKFTERGQVTLRIERARADVQREGDTLPADQTIAFRVSDTGIGIPKEALERVFAPFEQLEARTQRRYGGTGLGLAISRESARLLGGVLRVESSVDQGSTFTCYVPDRVGIKGRDSEQVVGASSPGERASRPALSDDRGALDAKPAHLLVIEDDPVLAEQLLDIIHARGLAAVLATSGAEGLALVQKHKPQGIILDVRLPDTDGFAVMEQLRRDPSTRDVPVHFVSAVDAPERGFSLGAVGYLVKPVSRNDLMCAVRLLASQSSEQPDRVLVVEDNAVAAESIVRLLGEQRLHATHVSNASAALEVLSDQSFSCMILDLGLPDMDGLGLLERLSQTPSIHCPPVIVYTARSLTKEETRRLDHYVEVVVIKDGHSEQRLIEELRLFAGHARQTEPHALNKIAAPIVTNVSLSGTKLLVVDDDMRTAYSLAALLRSRGAEVVLAENGAEALTRLAEHGDLAAVLMDIMMPVMDGYQAMRRLREGSRHAKLPVIALTAKAMQGERERCLAAGASDYLAKPVDSDELLTMLQRLMAPSAVHAR